nr:venom protein [Lampona murina]
MMWTLSLLILVFVGGSLSEVSDECSNFRKCHEQDIAEAYPETAEDLLTICRNIETLGNCELDMMEKCENYGGPLRESKHVIRNALSYLDSKCQANNPTFQVLSTNLQCMKPIVGRMDSCTRLLSDKSIDILKSHAELSLFESYESERAKCLESVLDIKCEALVVGHRCGEDVADAVEDVMMHMSSNECTPEILEEFEPLFDIFEALVLEEIELHNEIDKRK